jgi:hypothetical protein
LNSLTTKLTKTYLCIYYLTNYKSLFMTFFKFLMRKLLSNSLGVNTLSHKWLCWRCILRAQPPPKILSKLLVQKNSSRFKKKNSHHLSIHSNCTSCFFLKKFTHHFLFLQVTPRASSFRLASMILLKRYLRMEWIPLLKTELACCTAIAFVVNTSVSSKSSKKITKNKIWV